MQGVKLWHWHLPDFSTSDQAPSYSPENAVENVTTAWAPATPVEHPAEAPGSW